MRSLGLTDALRFRAHTCLAVTFLPCSAQFQPLVERWGVCSTSGAELVCFGEVHKRVKGVPLAREVLET